MCQNKTKTGGATAVASPGAAEVEASAEGAADSTVSQAISSSGGVVLWVSCCTGAAAVWVVPSKSVKPSACVPNPVCMADQALGESANLQT